MGIASHIRELRVIALLGGILLVAGCTERAVNSPPAPITGSQDSTPTAVLRPVAPAQSHIRAAVRSARHRSVVAALKQRRHARIEKKSRTHAKAVKPAIHHNATEPETAANAGVVHHIGPKIIPLD
jgi:hypothetical protein